MSMDVSAYITYTSSVDNFPSTKQGGLCYRERKQEEGGEVGGYSGKTITCRYCPKEGSDGCLWIAQCRFIETNVT